MLSQTLTRSLRSTISTNPCTASCVCNCGRRFAPNNDTFTTQKRFRRGQGDIRDASPGVYRQKLAEQRRPVTAEEKKELQERKEYEQNWHLEVLERWIRLKMISIDGATAIDFLNAFAGLCDGRRARRANAASPVDVEKLQGLVVEHGLTETDGEWLAHCLLQSPKHEHKVYGKKLMYGMSHAGSERATIRIMMQALSEQKHKPATLKASEIQHMRKHLKQIAEQGDNYRATVLEGKVQYALGNHNVAIQLWTDAMGAAVAYAEKLADMRERGERRPDELKNVPGANFSDLDQPWIELAGIHVQRQEWDKAKWAIGVGCDMDDPLSHYRAAQMAVERDDNGEFRPTSTWLYHCTKAACSGHPQAAHELGDFYGRSGWRYIEDEPPDHVKPTPFDRFPPDVAKEETSFTDKLKSAFGRSLQTDEDPRYSVFKTAAFPADPVGRMRLALEWLDIAIASTYAPAHLIAAELRLEQTLWENAATPPEALRLEDGRYEFASRADYDAGVPIQQPPKEVGEKESNPIPNPFYDPAQAKRHLAQIFHAVAAQKSRLEHKAAFERARRRGVSVEEADVEEALDYEGREGVPPEQAIYFRFPDFREMYMDDARGVCVDDTKTPEVDIRVEAEAMCEEQKWDLYSEGGALLYRAGMRRVEPAGTGRGR